MAARPLRYLGDPILRARAAVVERVDAELSALIADMFDTMYAEDGVGLAAPQIGIGTRVIVIDPRDPEITPFALVNPEVRETDGEPDRAEEGCLSLPGLREVVERPSSVVVEGLGRSGEPVRIETAGLLARILQHEIDHLDGILFIDRVSPIKRRMLMQRWRKQEAR
jgi:peptide deformylase